MTWNADVASEYNDKLIFQVSTLWYDGVLIYRHSECEWSDAGDSFLPIPSDRYAAIRYVLNLYDLPPVGMPQ